MKKFYRNILGSMMMTVVLLSGCSSDEDETPVNVINDDTGIKIDLDWSTGGTVNDALTDTDLDLFVYKGGKVVLSSEAGSSFERIEFDPDLYADGTYTVSILLYETSEDVTYTATVNGITTSKPYTFNSNFVAGDESREVTALTIVKSGSTYTVQEF